MSSSSDQSDGNRKRLTKEQHLDKTIEKLGGFSYFQMFAYCAISFGINSIGYWFYQVGYFI